MKKLTLVSLVFIFVICGFSISTRGQSDTDAGDVAVGIFLGAIEDDLIKESVAETAKIAKELAQAAKEAKATKSILPLINSIKRNTKAILIASQNLPLERCSARLTKSEDALQGTISRIEKFQEQLCSNVTPTVSRTFHPMFEHCVIGSPNFQSCVCMHHPGGPGCGGTGGGMTGGSSSSGPSEPKCLSDEDFAEGLQRVIEIFEGMPEAYLKDSNSNGFPDICENNKKSVKPHERKHGGKKKPKKPKHGGMTG